MKAKILFAERQRFKQWWLWLLLLGIIAVPISLIYQQSHAIQPFSDPAQNFGIVFMLLVILPVTIFFFLVRLDSQMKPDGIYVRFYPIHLKFKHFPWSEIEQVYLRKYKPLSEFGGWGIRFGTPTTGKAYNISGNDGIQIVFKNGKKLLIGTNQPEAAAEAIKKLQPVKA